MPRTIREQGQLIDALNKSRRVLQVGMETVKTFADLQQLKFEDLETDRVRWSFDDRLIFEFNLTTTSIYSTNNQEYANKTGEAILEYVTRGVEAYALWHALRYDHVRVVRIHWASYYEMVVTYA